jgi:hypothetical protein
MLCTVYVNTYKFNIQIGLRLGIPLSSTHCLIGAMLGIFRGHNIENLVDDTHTTSSLRSESQRNNIVLCAHRSNDINYHAYTCSTYRRCDYSVVQQC